MASRSPFMKQAVAPRADPIKNMRDAQVTNARLPSPLLVLKPSLKLPPPNSAHQSFPPHPRRSPNLHHGTQCHSPASPLPHDSSGANQHRYFRPAAAAAACLPHPSKTARLAHLGIIRPTRPVPCTGPPSVGAAQAVKQRHQPRTPHQQPATPADTASHSRPFPTRPLSVKPPELRSRHSERRRKMGGRRPQATRQQSKPSGRSKNIGGALTRWLPQSLSSNCSTRPLSPACSSTHSHTSSPTRSRASSRASACATLSL